MTLRKCISAWPTKDIGAIASTIFSLKTTGSGRWKKSQGGPIEIGKQAGINSNILHFITSMVFHPPVQIIARETWYSLTLVMAKSFLRIGVMDTPWAAIQIPMALSLIAL